MSGEKDRSGRRPSRNPLFDESDAPPRRARKAKPPPGIITAGGVDMARAHASGIKVRDGVAAENTLDEPRVVVAVETDLRKVPTHRRLLDGRDAAEEGARSPVLPAGSPQASSPWAAPASPGEAPLDRSALPSASAPQPELDAETLKRRRPRFPLWMRVAAVLVLILLTAGLVRRVRLATGDPPPPVVAVERTALPTLPAEPAPTPPPATARAPRSPVPPVAPLAPEPRSTAGEPEAKAGAGARAARTPPPPRPAFTPPFQMPGEKN